MSGSSSYLYARGSNPVNCSPTLKCNGCETETGFVAIKAEHVKIQQTEPVRVLVPHRRDTVYHHVVVISFGCKHCKCEKSFHVTYEYEQINGVCVTEGYPPRYLHAHKRTIELQPLRSSQVETIKTGMNWPAYEYPYMTSCHGSKDYGTQSPYSCEQWANAFLGKLQIAKAEEVPPCPSKIVKADIVKEGTGCVLRRNVEMEFEIGKFFSRSLVTLSEMADQALEQSGLMAQGYQWRQVAQRKQLANGSFDYVEANFNDTIKHGAFYKVVAFK